MTQLNISIEEAKALSKHAMNVLKGLGVSSRVMGGFVRDSFFGRPVKDMDVYVDTPVRFSEEMMLDVATKFFAERDHKFELNRKEPVEGVEQRNDYHNALTVYTSVDVAEGDFPVDLIFVPCGWSHPGFFDLSICNCRIYFSRFPTDPDDNVIVEISEEAQRDFDNKTITISRLDDVIMEDLRGYRPLEEAECEVAFARLMRHVDRVKAKYEGFRLCINDTRLGNNAELQYTYKKLVQEGIFGQAGEILQTEAEGITWDEVRQFDREEAVRIVAEERERARQAQLQAAWGDVQRGAQVPPGLFDANPWWAGAAHRG